MSLFAAENMPLSEEQQEEKKRENQQEDDDYLCVCVCVSHT